MCSIFATTDLRSSFEDEVSYKILVLFMDEVASASLNCRSWELRLMRISSTMLLNIVASVSRHVNYGVPLVTGYVVLLICFKDCCNIVHKFLLLYFCCNIEVYSLALAIVWSLVASLTFTIPIIILRSRNIDNINIIILRSH